MPRKNARPAARRQHAKLKQKMAAKKSHPAKPRSGMIPFGGALATLAAMIFTRDTEDNR